MDQAYQTLKQHALPASDGQTYSLNSFLGKKVVLYFYPKDNTSACTLQALGYRDLAQSFEALNTVVIGVSRDGVKTHCGFIEKQSLNFLLLSDREKVWHDALALFKPKKMYGKDVIGVIRSTYIFDEKGNCIEALKDVKASEDPYHVLKIIESL